MTQFPNQPANPYAADAFDHQERPPEFDGPRRTSLMAVFSILCSLPCGCVPVIGVFFSALGVLLGALSLSAIKKARGQLGGRVAAIIGVMLGLIVSVIQIYFILGMVTQAVFYINQQVPNAERMAAAIRAADIPAARAELGAGADAAIDDERLEWFMAELPNRLGNVDAVVPVGINEYLDTMEKLGVASAAVPRLEFGQVMPFVIIHDGRRSLCWIIFDRTDMPQNISSIDDIVIFLPGDEVITLRADGLGKSLAEATGATVVTPD